MRTEASMMCVVSQMKRLSNEALCGALSIDCISDVVCVDCVSDLVRLGRFRWFGHIECKLKEWIRILCTLHGCKGGWQCG